MRRAFWGAFVTLGMLSAGTASVFAAQPMCAGAAANGDSICGNYNYGIYHWYSTTGAGRGGNFLDADGNGICDNYENAVCGAGGNYVDADGNGICDNYEAGTARGAGYGCGRGHDRDSCGNGFRGGRGRS